MSTLSGSRAGQAFADARAVLEHTRLPAADARPAIEYTGPADEGPPGPARRSRRSDAPAPTGPLHRAARDLRSGTVSCRDLVTAALAAVAERNDELVGVVALDEEGALAAADRLDERLATGHPLGALHGIPVTIKDVIDVAGLPTRCGSAAYEVVPPADALAVARLRAAGAIVVGKASTHEFALGVTSPQSRNPHDPTRIPGGSSGGSAISVATGMALASLGTDTRASIRVPAALSGVVGFKPTYGTVPTRGVVSLAWTMDHVAPMAASVADAALVLDVLTGSPGGNGLVGAALADVADLRVGVPAAPFAGAEDGVVAAVTAAIEALGALGCRVDPAERPSAADLELANAAGLVVSRAEAATSHRSLGLDRDRYWEEVAEQLAEAETVSAMDYLQAQRLRLAFADDLLATFAHHDVLVLPTAPVVAPPADDFAEYLMVLSRNAIPFSFVGFPALSVPCGTAGGLPVGLQVVAPPGREDLCVAVAAAVERATATA